MQDIAINIVIYNTITRNGLSIITVPLDSSYRLIHYTATVFRVIQVHNKLLPLQNYILTLE